MIQHFQQLIMCHVSLMARLLIINVARLKIKKLTKQQFNKNNQIILLFQDLSKKICKNSLTRLNNINVVQNETRIKVT